MRNALLLMIMLASVSTLPVKGHESNYHFSHSEQSKANPEKIWKIWTDVAHWKQWDAGLKEASLEGKFRNDARGKLIPDRGPTSWFRIENVIGNKSYTMKTRIPFGWLVIKRSLVRSDDQTTFTHDVEFTGPLKKILGNKIGKRYRAMLPDVMKNITKIAEDL